jgi:hypothetical protein
MGLSALCSSHSPQILISCCLFLTGAEVEGAAIPEAVPVEGVVPKDEVTTGTTSEPAEAAAPGMT